MATAILLQHSLSRKSPIQTIYPNLVTQRVAQLNYLPFNIENIVRYLGGWVKFNNTPNRCIQIDGQEHWISRSVTVLPVLFFIVGSKGYVPLGKRGDGMPDERGKWALPGGYLDYGETAGEAAIRETWEELGLNLPQLQVNHRFLGSLGQPYYVSSQPIRKQNVTLRFPLMFFLEQAEELPKLQPQVSTDEVLQAQWFALEEALVMALAFKHQEVMQHCLDTYYKEYYDGQSIVFAMPR